jgi:hypothetical protein
MTLSLFIVFFQCLTLTKGKRRSLNNLLLDSIRDIGGGKVSYTKKDIRKSDGDIFFVLHATLWGLRKRQRSWNEAQGRNKKSADC